MTDKIVSLQSVGLGEYRDDYGESNPWLLRMDYAPFYKQSDRADPKITEIEYNIRDYGFPIYRVYTDDGHYRVLPADKYIAEYAPEERGELEMTFYDRLIQEQEEVSDRLHKLAKYLAHDKSYNASDYQFRLMTKQLLAMDKYTTILKARIDDLEDKGHGK